MKPGNNKRLNQINLHRALLKLSGRAFSGTENFGISKEGLSLIVDQIKTLLDQEVQLAIVPGAGNITRGREIDWLDRITADHMGMLGTVINGLALRESLKRRNLKVKIISAIQIGFIKPAEPKEAINYLTAGQIVIFVGGTGNPLFTTDTAAALRASEIEADFILKATDVDGVYSKDPKEDEKAKLLKGLSYKEVIQKNLRVVDLAALDICNNNQIPMIVFNFFNPDNLQKLLKGEKIGTIIHP